MGFINLSLRRDFSDKSLEYLDIVVSKLKGYHFTNMVQEDWAYEELAMIMVWDFRNELINFTSYAKEGMDLRLFMEVRKSMMLPTCNEDFLLKHNDVSTPEEVKQLRVDFLKGMFMDYVDADWQFYYVMQFTVGGEELEDLEFDFDYLGILSDTPKDYRREDYIEGLMYKFTRWDCFKVDCSIRDLYLRTEGDGFLPCC